MSTQSQTAPSTPGAPTTADARQEIGEQATAVAREILGAIDADARYCSNCFRQFREFETPPEDADLSDCVVGFTHSTEHGITGLRNATGVHPASETARDYPVGVDLQQGLICECGVGHHRTKRRPVSRPDGYEHARRLSDAVHALAEDLSTEAERCAVRRERLIAEAHEHARKARDADAGGSEWAAKATGALVEAREQAAARGDCLSKADRWQHDRERLVRAYGRLKGDESRSGCDMFRKALTFVFIQQQLRG